MIRGSAEILLKICGSQVHQCSVGRLFCLGEPERPLYFCASESKLERKPQRRRSKAPIERTWPIRHSLNVRWRGQSALSAPRFELLLLLTVVSHIWMSDIVCPQLIDPASTPQDRLSRVHEFHSALPNMFSEPVKQNPE